MSGEQPAAAASSAAEQLVTAALAWAAAWDGIGDWTTPVEAERNKLRLTVAQHDLSRAAARYRAEYPPTPGTRS